MKFNYYKDFILKNNFDKVFLQVLQVEVMIDETLPKIPLLL